MLTEFFSPFYDFARRQLGLKPSIVKQYLEAHATRVSTAGQSSCATGMLSLSATSESATPPTQPSGSTSSTPGHTPSKRKEHDLLAFPLFALVFAPFFITYIASERGPENTPDWGLAFIVELGWLAAVPAGGLRGDRHDPECTGEEERGRHPDDH